MAYRRVHQESLDCWGRVECQYLDLLESSHHPVVQEGATAFQKVEDRVILGKKSVCIALLPLYRSMTNPNSTVLLE